MGCENAFQNLPDTCKDGNGLLLFRGAVISTSGQQFATAALAGDVDNWKSDIVDNKLFPYHKIKEVEDLTAESTNWESASGDIVHLFEGQIRLKITFYLTVEQHQASRSASGNAGNIYFYDRSGNIMCTSDDGVIRRGFKMSYINTETLRLPTADVPSITVMEIQLEDTTEFNETLKVIEPYTGTAADRWFPSRLPTQTKVQVTQVGSIVTDTVTFDVAYQSTSTTDNAGNTVTDKGIEGLDVATFTNFQFVIGGVITAPDSMTEEAGFEGRYTATITGVAAADTIQILAVSTDDLFYISDATAITS